MVPQCSAKCGIYAKMMSATVHFPHRELSLQQLIASSSWLVIEADSGGQTLLACPVQVLEVSAENLLQLAADLESLTWGSGQLAASAMPGPDVFIKFISTLDRSDFPSELFIDWNDGIISDGLWLHREFHSRPDLIESHVPDQVKAIVTGRVMRLTK